MRQDLTGRTFGRLTVVSLARSTGRRRFWICLCSCGATCERDGSNLVSVKTFKSCGCYLRDFIRETKTTHGMTETAEYQIWCDILKRCTNPNTKTFRYYGGRGIKVCERWRDFAGFYADMGARPSPEYTIDRLDNNGPYSKENCAWRTRKEQANNRSSNVLIAFHGETLNVSQWAQRTGFQRQTLEARVRKGWSAEKILTAPLNSTRQATALATFAAFTPEQLSDRGRKAAATRRALARERA